MRHFKSVCDTFVSLKIPMVDDDQLLLNYSSRNITEINLILLIIVAVVVSIFGSRFQNSSKHAENMGNRGWGRHAKRVDAALPGKHTRQLYDQLSWKEASVLAQLRTGMARLNGYLYRINVAQTDQCARGHAKETVEHFLFRCRNWTAHRTNMLQCASTHRGNISFFLGGKSPSDTQNWAPNSEAVRTSIRFAFATGRLDAT